MHAGALARCSLRCHVKKRMTTSVSLGICVFFPRRKIAKFRYVSRLNRSRRLVIEQYTGQRLTLASVALLQRMRVLDISREYTSERF